MPHIITGILAHVDAGKTTLSEALLYQCGAIRSMGRVDSKNAFLDTNLIERERGITIFAKQAILNDQITLIDTPGHVDFSAEMERTLAVLDAAILLVNASDGVQSHTKTLWKLLQAHGIPAVIFVNKMDMPDTNKTVILNQLKNHFGGAVTDFSRENLFTPDFWEAVAAADESLLEKYLDGKEISGQEIASIIEEKKLFPCVFGSALKLQGVEELINVLGEYFAPKKYPENFGCVVYKISKDKAGNRLSHIKITGGTLKVKESLGEEKVNEIRLYSGEKYESVKEICAGEVCAVTGLKNSFAGKTYGAAKAVPNPQIESALIYSVIPPKEIDIPQMLRILRDLEEELPELKVQFNEATGEINLMLMGEVQTEVVKELLQSRYHLPVEFGEGKIAYKETVLEPVVGVGHYEPLRHYAEVHLQLSPLPRGSGMRFVSELSVDELDTNWQRLIITHLKEKQHLGVLTGSPITDIEIRVLAGRAHLKHTEGGDFRQSTYRAIRHALMYSKSVLLEPVYAYEIVVPENCTGRVMSDIDRMHGTCTLDETRAGFSTLSGTCPVATMKNYINEVRSYTKGQGVLTATVAGYERCHNESEVIAQTGYNPAADLENPASSVFCSHGAGFVVEWNKVNDFKHITIK